MDHPYEYRAHYNPQGQPCHCPWGHSEDGEHLGSVKESSKLNWLQSRPDMQTPEGQQWLNFLQKPDPRGQSFADADKMLPWLTREYGKGRVKPSQEGETHHLMFPEERTNQNGITTNPWIGRLKPRELSDAQDSLEEMKKNGQGTDVMQHTVNELMPKVEDFQDWKKSQGRMHLGEPIHNFGDGWQVRKLRNEDETLDEGNEMGHCMAQYGKTYHDQVENGEKIFASLRDHNNLPHATMELHPSTWRHPVTGEESPEFGYQQMAEKWEPQLAGARVGAFYGKQDADPQPQYADRMNQWLGGALQGREGDEDQPEEANAALYDHPVMASHTRPLYYRWVYSPQKGVTINSNKEAHPALVKYHSDLSGDINDANLTHGFASAIGNGWRITDLAHQPVDDPYIVQQVVRRLNLEDGAQIRSEGAWQPSEYDFETLHYGLPREVTQN